MIPRQSLSSIVTLSLMLMISSSQAENVNRSNTLQSLKIQKQIFNVDREIIRLADTSDAAYVVADKAIIETYPVELPDEKLQSVFTNPLDKEVWTKLEAATWVLDGNVKAPRIVYTFSDPSCPYCNRFWDAARPWVDSGKVQLRHIVVGIIKADSLAKAAAIMEAPDRSEAFGENEKKARQGGIKPSTKISAPIHRILDANQRLMLSLGFRGTPGIIVKSHNGELKKYYGMPHDEILEEVLGPR